MSVKWYQKSGKEADVAVSTRIRFARNLKNYPFPCRLPVEQRLEVSKKVADALQNSNSVIANDFEIIEMSKISDSQAAALMERHLISPEFASQREGRVLIKSKDDSISIMVNEEDHLRIQVLKEGFDLEEAFNMADKLDTLLDNELDFAYSARLGYLTQCPTNLGTGMRASLMLHLPSLQISGAIARLAGGLSKLGIAMRGTYGEGTEAKGALYQLSNQITLGIAESAAIENLKSIALELLSQERTARSVLENNIEVIDRIHRSLGILKTARTMSSEECLGLLSNLRLGVEMGEIKEISYEKINSLMTEMQPGMLTESSEKPLDAQQRNISRAQNVRSIFENI